MNKLEDLKKDFLNEFTKIQELEGPSYLYDPIKYFVKSPGKRLRPIIVLFLVTVKQIQLMELWVLNCFIILRLFMMISWMKMI